MNIPERAVMWKEFAPDVVYFLRAGPFVKVGRTSGHPSTRIAQLQTGCPFPIELIGLIFGDSGREAKLHSQFSHLRACGEWFRAEPELLTCIDALLDSQNDRLKAERETLSEQLELPLAYNGLQDQMIEILQALRGEVGHG